MNQGTFSDYHYYWNPQQLLRWSFYGSSFNDNTTSSPGIFTVSTRDNDGGYDGINLFGSRLSKN